MADLKDLTYSIKFDSEEGKLNDIVKTENRIDSGFAKAARSAKGMTSEINKVADSASKAADETKKIEENGKKGGGIFSRLKDGFKNHTNSLQKLQNETQKTDNRFSKLGKTIAGAFTAKKIIDFGIDSAKVFANFEQGMANVKATLNLTGVEGEKSYKKLWNAAKEAGRTTKFSATQSADALNYLAMAGFDTEKSIQTLPQVLNLASAGGLELDRAANIATQSMAALGLKTKELPGFMDQMAKTAQKTNTNIDQLGEAVLVTGGVAKNFGMDTAELNTQLGILADAGYQSAKGGTALRNTLLNITGNDKVNDLLKEMGVNVTNSSGKFRKFNDIMVDLNKKLKDYTPAQQEAIKATIGGKENVQGLNIILDGAGEKYGKLEKQIRNSKGASEEMAATQNDTVQGAFKTLKSAIEDAKISMFDGTGAGNELKDALKSIAAAIPDIKSGLENVINKVASFGAIVVENKDIIIPAIAGIVTTFATMKIINTVSHLYGVLTGQIELTAGAQAILNAVMNANPMTLIITVVAGVVAALVTLYNTSDTAREKMNSFFSGIKNFGISALNGLINKVNFLIGGLNKLISLINKIPFVNVPNIPDIPNVGGKKTKQKAAKGTVNAYGGPTLVGENGPEIVNLNRGDTVTPNNTTNRLMNNGSPSIVQPSFTFNINANGADPNAAMDIAQEVKRQVESIFANASVALGYTNI